MALTSYALLIFSAVFMVVGCLRVVEFGDVGFTTLRRRVLVGIHLVGCLFFASALGIFAVDSDQNYKPLMHSFFITGVLLLFPVHIYLALKRRHKFSDPS